MAHKVAEKLIILKDVGLGLMCRIHSLINSSDNSTLTNWLTILESDRMVKDFSNNLIKKFPDIPPDIPGKPLKGFNEFKDRATEIKTALEDSYRTFLDVVIFKKEAWSVIVKCSNELLVLSYQINNDLMSDFLCVLTQYVKLHILVTRVEHRKLMVASYAKAYHYSAGNSEPKYNLVADLFVQYDTKFFRKLQDDCKEISDRVGDTLAEFWEPINKWSQKANLVKAKVFSVLESPESITKLQNEDDHYLLMQYNNMREWVLYGFLVCPLGLEKRSFPKKKKEKERLSLALELLQRCLSDVFVITVFRDVKLNIHKEYETLFSYFKGPKPKTKKEKQFNLSKYKSKVLGRAREDWKGCLQRHADLRTYLRVEMETLTTFFTEFPAVLCPKFQMVLALMHMSRDEILWYFLHDPNTVPHKLNQKKYEHYEDTSIAELIHLTLKLIDLVRKYTDQIAMYYMGYLIDKDTPHAQEVVDQFISVSDTLSSRDRELIVYLMSTLKGAKPENFESVRLNWYRISASISNANSGISGASKKTKDISQVMTQIVHRSRNVDCIDTQLRTHGSFQQLYYYRGNLGTKTSASAKWENSFTVFDCLQETMKPSSKYDPTYCMALLKIFVSALDNVHRLCPEEHSQIANQMKKMGDGFLNYIVKEGVETSIRTLIKSSTGWLRKQVSHEKVIQRMELALVEVRDGEEKKELPVPGSESEWKFRKQPRMIEMEISRNFIAQVCGSFAENDVLHLANIEFIPREYLIASASVNITSYLWRYFIKKCKGPESRDRSKVEVLTKDQFKLSHYIYRPTEVLANFHRVIYAYQIIEQHVGINISDIVRECLLREFYDDTVGTCGQTISMSQMEEKKDEIMVHLPLIKHIANWYGALFSRDLGVELNVSYSPVYLKFFSTVTNKGRSYVPQLNASHYTDVNELNALCTLIGPYGVRALDKALLEIIVEQVQGIKDILNTHRKLLSNLKNQFTERPLWLDSKGILTRTDPKQKGSVSVLDELVKYATITGCAIIFRRLLKDALHRVCSNTVPFIVKAVSLAFNEIHQNVTFNDDLAPLDYLAEDCGLNTTDFDHMLYDSLKMYLTQDSDRELWQLLPEAFGISYVCDRWQEAKYDVHSDSHNNNVRAIAECFYHLTLVFERITLKSESLQDCIPPDERIKDQLERFVLCSSYSTLHMQKSTGPRSVNNSNRSHIMLFLEQFITVSNNRVKLSFLEECFPYTTLRENYLELFEHEQKKEMVNEEEEQQKEEKKDVEGEKKEGIKEGENAPTSEGNTNDGKLAFSPEGQTNSGAT